MNFCYLKTLDNQHMSYALSARGKQWAVEEVIDIAFMGGTPSEKRFVKKYAELWLNHANLKFNWDVPLNKSDVRISFHKNRGSWSYVGTDALFINKNKPTMNFGWLDRSTVLHEFGHMLGLKHEHQNPKGGIKWNKKKVIEDLSGPPNNWDIQTIKHNVLDQADPRNVKMTDFDDDSIMLYPFPASWTTNMSGTRKNNDLSETDIEHISKLYPYKDGQEKPNKRVAKGTGLIPMLLDWLRSL